MKFDNKTKNLLTRYRQVVQKLSQANDELIEIEKGLGLSTFTPLEQWLLIGFGLGESTYEEVERNFSTLAVIESEMLAVVANEPTKKAVKAKKKVARKMIKKAPFSNSVQYLGNT